MNLFGFPRGHQQFLCDFLAFLLGPLKVIWSFLSLFFARKIDREQVTDVGAVQIMTKGGRNLLFFSSSSSRERRDLLDIYGGLCSWRRWGTAASCARGALSFFFLCCYCATALLAISRISWVPLLCLLSSALQSCLSIVGVWPFLHCKITTTSTVRQH